MESLAPNDRPQSLEEGYAIQQAVTATWPDEIAGWKVGATSKEVQALLRVSEPVYGPVFRKEVFQSPAMISAEGFQHRLLECEFVFRFGKNVPGRKAHYGRIEIIDSIDALFPGFEIICPRFTSLTDQHIATVVADFCANGGAVLGEVCSGWLGIDLASQTVVLAFDGTERQRGTGAIVLGNPLNVLDWFVNAFSQNGGTIEAGQFVMTGTMTGLHAPALSQTAHADFGLLGAVEAVFA